MSGRRGRYQDNSPSPEPIYLVREPRERILRPRPTSLSPPPRRRTKSVSFSGFSLNPFSRRRERVVIVKESNRNRRREERRYRPRSSPSPSPSPPRGPHHIMDPRVKKEGDYVPLPKKLPTKKDEKDSSSEGDRKKKRRQEKPKIIQVDPEDRDLYPRVERARSPPRERPDSGVFSMEGSPHSKKYYDSQGRRTYPPSEVQDVTDQLKMLLNQKEQQRLDAEKETIKTKQEMADLKAELERLKRSSYLDERERKVAERESQERQYEEPPRRPVEIIRPTREVIITQPHPPVRMPLWSDQTHVPRGTTPPSNDPLARAREDERRRREEEERRRGRYT